MGATCCKAEINSLHKFEEDIEIAFGKKKKGENPDYQQVISAFNIQAEEDANNELNESNIN